MKILITGAAGFIGAFLTKKLLETRNDTIIGIDNLNNYYDVSLKEERVRILSSFKNFTFIKGNLVDKAFIDKLFNDYSFNIVVNLATQEGVRYSITNIEAHINLNLIGFYNILEACRNHPVEHLVYASSSSVYGGNTKECFSIS